MVHWSSLNAGRRNSGVVSFFEGVVLGSRSEPILLPGVLL